MPTLGTNPLTGLDWHAEDEPKMRHCGEFGHELGLMPWYDETPDCAACARLVRREYTQRRVDRMVQLTHGRCGRLAGAVQSLPSRRTARIPRWHYWYADADGRLMNGGRRSTRANAMAATIASHDCEE